MNKRLPIFLLVLCCTVTLLRCGDDDDDNGSASIVGKWQVQSRELFDCPDEADNNTLQCTTSSSSADCGTWEFKTDGNYTFTYNNGGGYTFQYETYEHGGLNLCSNGNCYPFVYSISGDKLVITEGDLGNACLHKWTLVKI
jgi:hypothetical protein